MDLVPDDVLSSHLLPLLSFRDALRLYSSCGRFRRLLSGRVVPRLDVLRNGDPVGTAARDGLVDLVEFLVGDRNFWGWNWVMTCAAEGGHMDLVEYFVGNGASNWNWGKANAEKWGYLDLVGYFERKLE